MPDMPTLRRLSAAASIFTLALASTVAMGQVAEAKAVQAKETKADRSKTTAHRPLTHAKPTTARKTGTPAKAATATKPAKDAKAAAPATKDRKAAVTHAKGSAAKTPRPATWTIETNMARGDTLVDVLRRHSIDGKQAQNAVGAVADIYDPRRLGPGDKLTLMLERRPRGPWLKSLNLDPRSGQELTIQVEKDSGPSRNGKRPEPTSVVVRRSEGTVSRGLRESLRAAKVPDAVAADAIAAFGADPDVPRSPPKKSRFVVVYEAESRRGRLQHPTLRFAALNVGGKIHPVYRYQMNDGDVVFVDKDGKGFTQVDLGAPIQNAKVTSPFGWRSHPVYGEARFHKGVDFAAPEGTPVYAAEDGVIEEIGWRGGYGEYIRIRHRGQVATHYAHLSQFARGLQEGTKVHKGQLIGKVGETGVATGPHLDYGVIVNEAHVDPLAAHPVVPVRLAGSDLRSFRSYVKRAGTI